jgi:integrase
MVDRLRARRRTAKPSIWNVDLTSPMGGLRDPSNTQADLRTVFAAAGYGWVTSHFYRKTVTTLINSGLSPRQAADQLGHAKVSMTQDRYSGRKVARTGAAAVLEIFGTTADRGKSRIDHANWSESTS